MLESFFGSFFAVMSPHYENNNILKAN